MIDGVASIRRKSRADGQRNRTMILEAAHRILSDKGSAASLDEIAQAAGVGNGTLYRHFPTRAALVEAVCREDTRHLVQAATVLVASHAPLEAIGAWLEAFLDYIASKQLIAEATSALVSPSSEVAGTSSADVRAALTMLVDRAYEDGSIRTHFEPLDLLRAVAGVATIGSQPGWEKNAKRMIEVLVAGLKSR